MYTEAELYDSHSHKERRTQNLNAKTYTKLDAYQYSENGRPNCILLSIMTMLAYL